MKNSSFLLSVHTIRVFYRVESSLRKWEGRVKMSVEFTVVLRVNNRKYRGHNTSLIFVYSKQVWVIGSFFVFSCWLALKRTV